MPAAANLVHQTTTTTGTGNLTLSTVNGKQSFDTAFGHGATTNVFDYFISHQSAAEYERGTGHMSDATTLVRDTVIESTNANAAVNFSAGTKDVTCDIPAGNQVRDSALGDNIALNGAMEVSQENGTTAVTLATGTEAYVVDMWTGKFVRAATLAMSVQQVSSPTPPAGFQYGLQLKATTGLASLATGDYGYISQPIEGYRVSKLDFGKSTAKFVTIGFWVYTTIAGTMAVTLVNSANNRSYVTDVVVNSATTWEFKTVTVLADTSGTWLYTTGIGLRVIFCFGCGATFQGTAGSWQASQIFGSSSTTNFFASTNNVAVVTGVTLAMGRETLTFERALAMQRPLSKALLECQRYWEKSWSYGTAVGTATYPGSIGAEFVSTNIITEWDFQFKVQKRAAPTVTTYSTATGASGKVETSSGDVTSTINSVGENGAAVGWTGQKYYVHLHFVADARL